MAPRIGQRRALDRGFFHALTDSGRRPTADIARSRKRALKLMQAALRIAAKGRRNTLQQVRTNLTRLTPAYELDQRIAG